MIEMINNKTTTLLMEKSQLSGPGMRLSISGSPAEGGQGGFSRFLTLERRLPDSLLTSSGPEYPVPGDSRLF